MTQAQRKAQQKAMARAIAAFEDNYAGMAPQVAFGIALQKSKQFISKLKLGDERVPAELCLEIEWETRQRGKPVLVEELRTDVKWYVLLTRPRAVPDELAEARAEIARLQAEVERLQAVRETAEQVTP